MYQLRIFIYKIPLILFPHSQVQPKRRSGNLKMWEWNNNPSKNSKKKIRYYLNLIVETFLLPKILLISTNYSGFIN